MYNLTNCSPALTNCTFSGNSATTYGGGMANLGSSPMLTNCILWDNSAPEGGEIYNDGTSTPTVTYCDVQGGYIGGGNIDSDPLFVDADGSDNIVGTPDDDLHLHYHYRKPRR